MLLLWKYKVICKNHHECFCIMTGSACPMIVLPTQIDNTLVDFCKCIYCKISILIKYYTIIIKLKLIYLLFF